MKSVKVWYKSTTVQAVLVLLVFSASQILGVDITSGELENILGEGTEAYTAFLTLIFSLMALYGRLKAKDKLI